jgi:hypothetical protein
VGETYGTHETGHESVQGFGGKARRKGTTGKTKAYMTGWDQNGSEGDWLGDCREWIQVAQGRGRWGTVVNTVMNLRVVASRSWLGLEPI